MTEILNPRKNLTPILNVGKGYSSMLPNFKLDEKKLEKLHLPILKNAQELAELLLLYFIGYNVRIVNLPIVVFFLIGIF